MSNQTIEQVPLLKSTTVKTRPLSAENQKALAAALAAVEIAEARSADLDSLKQVAQAAADDFALGVLEMSEALALAGFASSVEARKEAEVALRRGCRRVIENAVNAARPALAEYHSNRAEALRAEAQKLETAERDTASNLGQDPDAFEASELLKRLRATHAAAVERARAIEDGQRVNISELREILS